MIYVFIYAIYFFSDTGVNQHFPKKTKKSIKTETYKVKINICAHYLKVTFGFQKTKQNKKPQIKKYNSIINTITTTNNNKQDFFFSKGFSCNKGICDETMTTPDKFTNEAERVSWVRFSTHTHTHITELKALVFQSLTSKHLNRQSASV